MHGTTYRHLSYYSLSHFVHSQQVAAAFRYWLSISGNVYTAVVTANMQKRAIIHIIHDMMNQSLSPLNFIREYSCITCFFKLA